MCLQKKIYFTIKLPWKVLNFFYHIFVILNSFSNPCTSWNSRHAYYFIRTEGGFVNSSVISTKYRPSPVPSGGLEIPLLFKFSCLEQKTFEKMRSFVDSLPAGNYILKVNNRNARTKCEICSKLTIKTPERRKWRCYSIFIVNFEYIWHLVLMFLLLTLSW